MRNVMGMIYTGESDSRLRELTLTRAVAALPIAGRYRVIDFLLSSMVNSGLRNVGVVMQKNYHSLMDHLGSGKEWDLHGKSNGLFILPPFLTRENVGVYGGVLDALRSNTSYLNRSKQEYIILSNSNMIFNADFGEMIRRHIDGDSDITLMYSKDPTLKRNEHGVYLAVDDSGEVTDMEVDPTTPSFESISMEVCLMKRELLRRLVDQGVAHGLHDFNRDILQRAILEKRLKVRAHAFEGKVWRIDSVQAYFQCNLDILESQYRHYLFSTRQPIYTKVRDEMPAHYGNDAEMVNTLVADGCVIEGDVHNSILFRGVRIAPDAHIRNCIIMQDGQVHSGTYIENCILDKQAVIKGNTRLIGPASYPIVVSKNVVI